MKKVIAILGLILSLHANAGTENLNSALLMTFSQKTSVPNPKHPSTLIYVGQDMEHPLVAIANESAWAGQHIRIG